MSLLLLLSLASAQTAAAGCMMAVETHAGTDQDHAHHAVASTAPETEGSAGGQHTGPVECALLMCSAAAPGAVPGLSTTDPFAFDPAGAPAAGGYTSAILTFEPPPPKLSVI
ncbi:MAG TPA: hypothetical protein VFZ69_00565 [Longimicrobiales bacterium]